MIYYAHSMRIYNRPQERSEWWRILLLGRQRVLNPKEPLRGVADWKSKAFALIDKCEAVVFTTYCDSIGKGVYTELQYAFKTCKPVYLLVGWKLVPVGQDQLNVIYGRTGSWVYYAEVKDVL